LRRLFVREWIFHYLIYYMWHSIVYRKKYVQGKNMNFSLACVVTFQLPLTIIHLLRSFSWNVTQHTYIRYAFSFSTAPERKKNRVKKRKKISRVPSDNIGFFLSCFECVCCVCQKNNNKLLASIHARLFEHTVTISTTILMCIFIRLI
jgi:hypothetical protein